MNPENEPSNNNIRKNPLKISYFFRKHKDIITLILILAVLAGILDFYGNNSRKYGKNIQKLVGGAFNYGSSQSKLDNFLSISSRTGGVTSSKTWIVMFVQMIKGPIVWAGGKLMYILTVTSFIMLFPAFPLIIIMITLFHTAGKFYYSIKTRV